MFDFTIDVTENHWSFTNSSSSWSDGDILQFRIGPFFFSFFVKFTATLISTVIGVLVSAVLARSVASLLFGVNARDPATFAAMTVVLMAVALAACYVPARRATMVNPLVALKTD